jgi:hypothetical protein
VKDSAGAKEALFLPKMPGNAPLLLLCLVTKLWQRLGHQE